MNRILIIDDDRDLCALLAEYLVSEGFAVDMAHDGNDGLEKALKGDHDLLVLDVMLPGKNGFEVLRSLRSDSRLPVIMLSARGEDVDRIVGLEIGADDYLPKPFNTRELVARIKAVLRRFETSKDTLHENLLQVGEVSLDLGSHDLFVGERKIELTSVEYKLLESLVQSAGKVIRREELVRHVLERPYSPFDRSIDVHISNLRKKLGQHSDGTERIKTIRGEGYLYSLPQRKEE
ncbi:MAG: response regulator transcription factor [Synergistales bacterium]|nr:response regulator transcription factor [Synergistales bacterium]